MKRKEICLIVICMMLLVLRINSEAEPQLEETPKHGELIYELDGGSNSILNPQKLTEQDIPFVLKNPQKEGYLFGGWYLEPEGLHRVYTIENTAGQRLYAKWNLCIDCNRNVQEYPYHAKGENLLLKDVTYSFLYELDTPGNPKTRIKDLLQQKYASEYQCPQGLCLTKDYIIVSSYALEEDKLGALTLYDRNTLEHVISFGMEADSHLGGIAYDGRSLWICHSNTKELERISYAFIQKLATQSNEKFIDITHCFDKYKVYNTPSAIMCYGDKIYVATHHIYTPGVLYTYTFLDDTLLLEKKSLLPQKVQGLCVDDHGYCYVSQSYGRNQSSYLSIYDNLEALQKNFLNERLCVEMPPGSEAVVTENGVCYVLFETSSYKYYEGSDGKGICLYPLDKILLINQNSLFYD